MDSFGIFKLISSLSDFLSKNKTPQNSPADDRPLFSGLLSEQPKKPEPPAEIRATLPPLRDSMLSTMSSHDAFVKRVKEKNKK